MSTRFREILAAGELARLFAIGRLLHPILIDMYGLAGGFHGFWLDQEHCGLTYEQIQLASVCARANNFDSFVRMAPSDYALVTQNLEAGAGGVMAAQIRDAEHAEQFVKWAKFAPRGYRGMNNAGRDADYTHKTQEQFAVDSNRDHFIAIQIETLGALEQAEQISAIDGVDLLFVGPSDLSQAMGLLGQFAHKKVVEALDHVAAACRRHGKHWGTVAPNKEYTQMCYDKGCRMLTLSTEITVVKHGIEQHKAAYKGMF
jgi:4-hydroxy-2-oxoheptanedioate aldolase